MARYAPLPRFPATEKDLTVDTTTTVQMSAYIPSDRERGTTRFNLEPRNVSIDTPDFARGPQLTHVVPIASPERDDLNSTPKVGIPVPIDDVSKLQEEPGQFLSIRTLIEALSVFCAAIPIIVAPHLGAYKRGFYCNDPNIMYPFYEGTVKPWLLYLFCLGLPFVTVLIGEACRFFRSPSGYGEMEKPYMLWKKGPKVPPVVVSSFRILTLFVYGFLITKSVTDICKYAVGRLRPHFLDVCKPDWNLIGDCSRRYVMEFHCTTVNDPDSKVQYRLRDSRLSFLSGHASMAFYSMFFLIFYLESRLRWNNLRYCKAIVQFGLFLMAALTGLSRISDHKHHWTDVFAGSLLGLVIVLITVFVIGDFFNDARFLRYKLIRMMQKLDWGDEGIRFARILSQSHPKDGRILKRLKNAA